MDIRTMFFLKMVMATCLATAGVTILACSSVSPTSKGNGETTSSPLALQGTGEPVAAQKTEQSDLLSRLPKRQPTDPIYVNLTPPILDEKMQQAEKAKGVMDQRIRGEFAADPIIKLIDSDPNQSGLLKPHIVPNADVEVTSKVSLKEAYGLDQKTGKPNKVLAVVFEATIISQMPPATYKVSELGYAVRNQEVSKRFANHIKHVILEKIAPTIPAH